METLRWLSAEDMANCVSMLDVIDAVRQGFIAYSNGSAVAPPRTAMELPEGMTLTMPAALPVEGTTAVKIVSVYPGNTARGLPTITGLVAVLDATTGEPQTLMDGGYLTGLRTGAASGVATDLLAAPGARVLGLIGTGYQARFQAEAVAAVRPIEMIRVYSRDVTQRVRFVDELGAYLRGRGVTVAVLPASTPAEAVDGAPVVCAATSSSTPVLAAADLLPGAHINGVGSYRLDMQEIPDEIVRCAQVFVDAREAARTEAGDLLPAVEAGVLDWVTLPEIGEALSGARPGRQSSEEVTFFKSVGIAVQDVAAAGLVSRRAHEMGIGQPLIR
ncbi:MAG: ornithine cyclodeaminase family protein [Chloroflexia bacterium]|nr:ornithine cyclodeaminase family protein [Chloroflexia bacterium]